MIDQILFGDCREGLRAMAAAGVRARTCVTSPPYMGQRNYGGGPDEIGLEDDPFAFTDTLVDVFRLVRDVLADDGTLWVNMGDKWASGGGTGRQDSRGENFGRADGQARVGDQRAWRDRGIKPKDMIGLPWMLAFAMRADGWFLRNAIVWAKGTSGAKREGNIKPESVRDRCSNAYEHIFLFSKRSRYYYDADAIKEPAKDWGQRDRSNFRGGTTDKKLKHHGLKNGSLEMGNRRDVWRINPRAYPGAHYAVYPPELIEPCVLAGSRPGDIVLDPFMGSGTTAEVAIKHGRHYLGCELNADNKGLQDERIAVARAAVAAPAKKRRAPRPATREQFDLFVPAA